MSETLEQRQNTMRRVIQHLLDEKPYDNLSFEERRIAKDCADKGYIEGIELVEMVTGDVVMEYRFKPFLTESGIAFLSERNSRSTDNDTTSVSEQERLANQEKMIEQLKKIADSYQKRTEIAENEAVDIQKRLKKETRRSNINAGIAIIAVIVAILAWLVPRELVICAIQNLLDHIN